MKIVALIGNIPEDDGAHKGAVLLGYDPITHEYYPVKVDSNGVISVDTEVTVSGTFLIDKVDIGKWGGVLVYGHPLTETTFSGMMSALDVDVDALAKEVTLSGLKTSFESEDFSQEITLSGLKVAFESEDFSQEATLSGLKVAIDNEDFAQETTLSGLKSSFEAEDFTHEVTLSGLKTVVETEDFAQEVTLSGLKTDFEAEDFAHEVTLSGLKSSIETEDFAQEVTLSGIKSDFESEDFSQETTLSGLKVHVETEDFAQETTLSGIKSSLETEDFAQDTTLSGLKVDFETEDFAQEVTLSGIYEEVLEHEFVTASNGGVDIGTESTVVLASNAGRLFAAVVNDSDTTIYLSLGATAIVGSGIRLNSNGGSFDTDWTCLYRGVINAIHSGSGSKRVTVVEGT